MSRRQVKLQPEILLSTYDDYKDTLITFVTRDKKSILARIEKIDNKVFQLRNTMRHKISLDLRDIQEIWIDEKVS